MLFRKAGRHPFVIGSRVRIVIFRRREKLQPVTYWEQTCALDGRMRRCNGHSLQRIGSYFAENRSRDQSAKTAMRHIIKNYQDHKLRILSRDESDERGYQPIAIICPSRRIN